MHSTASSILYSETGFFSALVTDYIGADEKLQQLYQHPVSSDGFIAAIQQRNNFNTNRQLLVQVLQKQYANIQLTAKQQHNIQSLLLPNTYSITTAHQPNIFTGHLYFVYKILHAIKIAQELSEQMPQNNFVPVYYMGSEDADLDELGHIYLDGIKYQWQTKQTGAVGRMLVDQSLIDLITSLSGQLLVHPFGPQIVQTIIECYTFGNTIEQATFLLVNQLFAEYGLLVVLPDNADLKASFNKVLVKELVEQFSHKKVEETAQIFPSVYKAKMSGRPLNLFYLQQNSRNRIEWDGKVFTVVDTDLMFTKEQILDEVHQFPERFSPNVILRPVFQEWILPNIAFVGGGGEIAYWLTLKKVFEDVAVPYP
jgi:bacillithiol synthase